MAWIRDRVDPDAPDETHIVFGIDCSEQAEAGERAVSLLLGSSMEGDEGVFYLLPQDLCYEATRSGGNVTVDLLTLAATGDAHPDQPDPAGLDWVTVLSATLPFPEDAPLPGPPLVLIDHEGVISLDDLLATVPEAGVHIVGPKPGG